MSKNKKQTTKQKKKEITKTKNNDSNSPKENKVNKRGKKIEEKKMHESVQSKKKTPLLIQKRK